MLGNLTGWHLLIIVAIVLLLFGATRLPALARSIGQSTKIFREEMKSDPPAEAGPPAAPVVTNTAAVTPPTPVVPIPDPAAPGTSAESGTSGTSAKS